MKQLPLGYRLYALFWTLFLPAGVILVFAGAVVPGLVLLVLFVVDQAVFTPLIVARSERQDRASGGPGEQLAQEAPRGAAIWDDHV